MTYNSPKTLRRRQQRAEDRPARRPRKPSPITVSTDEEWGRQCDYSIACLHTQANEGHCDAAGRHARALIHMAVYRRALQIMRDQRRGYVTAMVKAQDELLNCEIAACGHVNTGCGDSCNIRDGYGVGL